MFIAAQFTITNCQKQPRCPSGNEWIKEHIGIVHSRKKEGTPTFFDTVVGTGEHYPKWDKAGSGRQIPCGLTYKRNLMKKTNKWAKQNQRHGNKEQTDSDHRGGGRESNRRRRGSQWTYIKDPQTWTTEWWLIVGAEGGRSSGEQWGKIWDNCNRTTIKFSIKNLFPCHNDP